MSRQPHRSAPRILNRRTLQRDCRHLLALLRPGMSVLDVGCGTGSITAGIAQTVTPTGRVLGLDRDESLLRLAREEYGNITHLEFTEGDVLSLRHHREFDLVAASRVLQWISRPGEAIERMCSAARPDGLVVALDYNHEDNAWIPDPPASFRRFYRAFLDWRAASGWDNHMADHLPELFRNAGLTDLRVQIADEVATCGDAGFEEASVLWLHVIETAGSSILDAGFLEASLRLEAARQYRDYISKDLQR